jgi:hypothetical protein
MLIFRIERNGIGPFRSDEWEGQDELLAVINDSTHHNHPIPYDDGLRRLDGSFLEEVRYGAPSKSKLFDWVPEEFHDSLEAAGFMVVCYEAGSNRTEDDLEAWRMGHSGKQIAYNPMFVKEKWRKKISKVFSLTMA